MGFRIVLWDIDGTLLDFLAAERVAIRKGFARLGLGECTDEMLAEYSAINSEYWRRLAFGELTKAEILVMRFRDFFSLHGIDPRLAEEFNERYQHDLGDVAVFRENALETVLLMKGKVFQCAATNGTVTAARNKLHASGLDKLLDGIYISDDLGVEKPGKAFFDKAFSDIEKNLGPFSLSDVLIVGDSTASDMMGGTNAGIKTCWLNPSQRENTTSARIDYEIRDLSEVPGIVLGA